VRHPRAAALARAGAALRAALRAVLDADAFVEADVPPLLPHAGQEAHLHPPRVRLTGWSRELFLQTSPELCLKRLVCAGLERVYALGPAFRGGREEVSRRHQPSFTMLEWYRPGEDLAALQADVGRLVAAGAHALGSAAPGPPLVLRVDEALRRWAGVDPGPLLDGDAAGFARAARAAGLTVPEGEDPATAFGRVLVERVEPGIAAHGGLVHLTHYPAFGAALARLDPDDARLALRTESYLHGVELANGYVELREPDEHRRRWARERRERKDEAAPLDEGLLGDLAAPGLPACVGMALGVDRLHMALAGAGALADVLPFAWRGADEAP